jgi:hypothetical protein
METTFWHAVRVLLVLAIAGCASAPPAPPPVDESARTAAGFKVLTATTAVQRTPARLPRDRLTGGSARVLRLQARPGQIRRRAEEFAAYQRLRQNADPQASQRASGRGRCRLKRDARWRSPANGGVGPWYFWPTFVELGW